MMVAKLISGGEKKREPISEEEIKRNKEATRGALSSVSLEGFVFSDYEKSLFERLDNGEIDDQEFLSLVHAFCGIKTHP